MNFKLLSYAQSFVSFLSNNLEKSTMENLNKIILFGSVARGEANKQSDVDLFIDVSGEEGKINKKVNALLEEFYKSVICIKYWHLLGIHNEIKPIVGKIDSWESLKSSIVANGTVLYGKYSESFVGSNSVILFWDKIKSESKRVLLSKKIYGYSYAGKRYAGVIERLGGRKLASNCIMMGVQHAQQVLDIFKELEITVMQMFVSVLE